MAPDTAANDTDTLLAILSSLLPEPVPDHDVLLDALVRADGDVQRAIELISAGKALNRGHKRKGLDSWLQKNSPVKARALSAPAAEKGERGQTSLQSPADDRLGKPTRKPNSTASYSSSRRSASPTKPAVNAFELLKPQSSTKPPSSAKQYPPLTLSNPKMVTEHSTCTLHPSILPAELASDIFYTMLHESRTWGRNKWYMFDRLVESPHRSAFYTRTGDDESEENQALHQVAKSWYNGHSSRGTPRSFPKSVERACQIVEEVVNREMLKRTRFPLEWGGIHPSAGGDKIVWRANFCASNMYEGAKETVGYHSDRLTAIGPYATIASISLGAQRTFRLREVIPVDERDQRAARTFNIPLPHNSLLIMHGSTQERFKHTVPPQTTLDRFHPPFPPPASLPEIPFDPAVCRINITFRFYRPDFHPESVPICKCGEPATLRPDMKKLQRQDGRGFGPEEQRGEGDFRYWWSCTAGDQNEGKSCNFWKVMDVREEGRGPFVMDENESKVLT